MGASMSRFVASMRAAQSRATGSSKIYESLLERLVDVFRDEAYIIWFERSIQTKRLLIVIKDSARPRDLLVAWWTAISLTTEVKEAGAEKADHDLLKIVKRSQTSAEGLLRKYDAELKRNGWDMDDCVFEVPSSGRIRVKE